MLRDETVAAAMATDVSRVWWLIERGDRDGYARAFLQWWSQGDGFMILEQDVVPAPGQLVELATCEQLWCCVPYSCGGLPMAPNLGCVKFAGELVAAERDTMATYILMRYGRGKHPYWRVLNEVVATVLTRAKASCHVHHPPARHLHDYAPGEHS